MYDQHSQALSTRRAPLETGSRKRSGLFVIFKRIDLRLVLKHSTITDAPRTERQLQHPGMLSSRRILRLFMARARKPQKESHEQRGCEPQIDHGLSILDIIRSILIILKVRILDRSSN
jgi:hypothetical protein